MLKFKFGYLILALLIFSVEILIALFVHDNFVRPYVGDFLVVILIYSFLRSFLNLSVRTVAVISLLFCYLIETLQYFNIAEKLGLQNSKPAAIIIGNSFSWTDIFAYTAGILFVLLSEKMIQNKINSPR